MSLIVLFLSGNACTKSASPEPPTQIDTLVVIPTPSDTISYIKRIEEYYVMSNPTATTRQKDITFHYDDKKRVIRVGFRNYNSMYADSATCILFYEGNNTKPYKIITPDIYLSSDLGSDYIHDTTYFNYNNKNQILNDSSRKIIYDRETSTAVRFPNKRYYTYPDSSKMCISWFAHHAINRQIEIFRTDTVTQLLTHQINKIKTEIYLPGNQKWIYAETGGFVYTEFINPLSKLNIGGTIFSIIHNSGNTEVLGNAVFRGYNPSNIQPKYFDFYSPNIPSLFYLSTFSQDGNRLGPLGEAFDIRITPWVERNTYPSVISVGATTALGDRRIYKYFY